MFLIPEWIMGDESLADPETARQFLTHTREPRFICRFVDEDEEDYDPGGFSYADGSFVLCEFEFIDDPPTGEAVTELCRRAMGVLG